MNSYTIFLVLVIAVSAVPKAEGQFGKNLGNFFNGPFKNPGNQIGGIPSINSIFGGQLNSSLLGRFLPPSSNFPAGFFNSSSIFGNFSNLKNIFSVSQSGSFPNISNIINGFSGGNPPCISNNATTCQMCLGVLKPSASINNTIKTTFDSCLPKGLNSTVNGTISSIRNSLPSIFGCHPNSTGIGGLASGLIFGLQGLFNSIGSGYPVNKNFTCCMTSSLQQTIINNAIAMVPTSVSSNGTALAAFTTSLNSCAVPTPVTSQTDCSISKLLNCVFQSCLANV